MEKLLFLTKHDDFGEQQNYCRAFISDKHCVQIIQESYYGVFPHIETDTYIVIKPLGEAPHHVWTKDRETAKQNLLKEGYEALEDGHEIVPAQSSLVYRLFDYLEGDWRDV